MFPATPSRRHYDVVIIGGAIMGSSAAWHLATDPDFDGSILVVERDPSYQACSTAHTNSSIRQQFSHPLNIRISQHTADFISNLQSVMGGDPRVPNLAITAFGYLYLAGEAGFAAHLRRLAPMQRAHGAATEILTPDQIAARYPFYHLDDILLGSLNLRDEGYWDGGTLFDWFRRKALENKAEYIHAEVVDMVSEGARLSAVTLSDGTRIGAGTVVNAAGPRAARVAAMAGLSLPVAPRKRYTWVFRCDTRLERALPLTIDPSGIHVRQDGPDTYLCGAAPDPDTAVDPDDFSMETDVWLDRVWPVLAHRIPRFERIRVIAEWAGHYAFNSFDQNALIGPAGQPENLLLMNGFSGHGLQQAPAMGRGIAEWITHGGYRTLDLSPFHIDRIASGTAVTERAII